MSEVNTNLAGGYFIDDVEVLPQLEFQMKLAKQLLHNNFEEEKDSASANERHL